MSATKNNSLSFYIHSAIVLIFMFLFRYLPAPEPLTAFGMNVLGIFIGAIYAWCTIGMIWPSILALILLGFSGYNTVAGCFGAAISNSTVLLIIFMCIFATLAQVSGLTNYIANKIITMKIVNGRPWVLSFMLMVACTVATALVDSVPAILICWGFLYEVAEEAGYQKGDKWPLLMIIGIVFASIMGFSFFPFKVAVVANFGFLESAMGSTVSYSYGAYMLFNFIYAMINLVAYILVCKYILRADVSKLQNFKIEKKEVSLDKRQKITIALIVGLIICMLIPNFVPTTFWLSATLKAIGTTGIAVMFLGIAAFLRCDGEPYVNFAQLAAKGMPWDLVFMISTALTLAGALVSQDSGLSAFIVKNVGGVLGAGSAIGFIVIFLVASAILTNLINNIVVSAIFIPIMYTFSTSLGFDPVPVVVLFIIVCNMAILLPSSSPAGAMIHSNKEWVPGTSAIKYGFIFMIMSTLIAICIGLPMLKIFF